MKKILALFCLAAMALPTLAQTEVDEDPTASSSRDYSLRFGPTVGATFTKFSQPDEGKLFDGTGVGFTGGAALKMRFGRMSEESNGGTGLLGAGIEVKYSQRSAKTVAVNEDGEANAKLQMGYIEVPVFVDIYPFYKMPKLNTFYVQLGAEYAGTMSVKPKTLSWDNPNAETSNITYQLDNNGSKLKGSDVRALVGVGYSIPNTGLDINARYYRGFSELAGNFKAKASAFEVSVAYYFDL